MWQCPHCPASLSCRGLFLQHYRRHLNHFTQPTYNYSYSNDKDKDKERTIIKYVDEHKPITYINNMGVINIYNSK